ncbi:hypothetical protein B0H15DRAFT_804231 [Mycena belliarum]|uniref:BAG domain-containing protein n=1 Tax=Mycena belliarum TaxID=1033014 RepID=A0AAD6TZS9_9AGAR|nr:hypothetical protein B0H15DRAFT_804231 [Mycena belliae]
MYSFYPSYRPQTSYYHPSPYYHQPSPYARALAQQQEQRARAQELERQRAARSVYFPDGYEEPDSDDENYYLTPRQSALLRARRLQEAAEQRNRDAARLMHEREMKEQQQACAAEKQSTPPPQTRAPTPPDSPSASPAPQAVPVPSREVLDAAATKIQTQYRIHHALRSLSTLAAKFATLKASFVPPPTIDFQAGDGTVTTIPIPAPTTNSMPTAPGTSTAKLAYTPANAPLHAYAEHLSRLLVALDAVESRGARAVRARRRGLARAVEGEAERVEALWRGVWAAHQQQEQHRADEAEVCAMVVDAPEQGAEPLPELSGPESDLSDVEPELPTPPASPAAAPKIALAPDAENVEDVVAKLAENDLDVARAKVAEDEKISGEEFVIV